MRNMYAVVFLLVVITSASSVLCFSSDNDGDEEIFMVVDDQMTMHDAGSGMSTANPVQIGKFLLEDGKVLTLSRKSSPSRNCIPPGDDRPCGAALDWCCEGLYCKGDDWEGICVLQPNCLAQGEECRILHDVCCFPNNCIGPNDYQRTCG